jgi:hypothetical protein
VTSTPLSIVKTPVISNIYRCEQMVQEVKIGARIPAGFERLGTKHALVSEA